MEYIKTKPPFLLSAERCTVFEAALAVAGKAAVRAAGSRSTGIVYFAKTAVLYFPR